MRFLRPTTAQPVGRNPLAFPLAPILGISVGGPSSVAMIFIIYMALVSATLGSVMRQNAARTPRRPATAATMVQPEAEQP